MPYCSIEEAWGTNFNNGDHKDNLNSKTHDKPQSDDNEINYRNIVPEDASSNLAEYSDIDFDSETLISNRTRHQKEATETKKLKKRRSFSRTMNRLPGTSGPKSRLTHNVPKKVLTFSDNIQEIDGPTKRLSKPIDNDYQNLDTPISDYNKQLEQKLYDTDLDLDEPSSRSSGVRQRLKMRPIRNKRHPSKTRYRQAKVSNESNSESESDSDTDTGSDITTSNYQPNEDFRHQQLETYKDLEGNELEKQRETKMKNNMLDIIVYVITGIFLIFILDLFVKLGKNARTN